MIEFRPGRYCSQIWFVDLPSMGCNILGALFRDEDAWRFIYRFRYDAGTDDPWDGSDRKSWYAFEASIDTSEEVLLSSCNRAAAKMAARCTRSELHELPVRSADPKYIMDQLCAQPWSNMRSMTSGDGAAD